MTTDYQISEESAQKELSTFLEYYEVEVEDMEDKARKAFDALLPVIIRGIRKGMIEFNNDDENGQCVVQTLRNKKVIKYKEMNGQAKMAMNKKAEDDASGQCYALLGSLCGEGETLISKLKGPDLKRAEHIGGMLLFC